MMEWGLNPATVGAIATAVAAIGTITVLVFIRRTAEATRKGLEVAEKHTHNDLQIGLTSARLNSLSTLITYHFNEAARQQVQESDHRTKAQDYVRKLERELNQLPESNSVG